MGIQRQFTFRFSVIAILLGGLSTLFPVVCQASGLLIADGGLGGKLEIVEQDVRVTINNGIAVTHIDQVFLNKEQRIVEALYTFPVPNNASVSNFSMIINGKEMIGEVVEKERAREIYNSYKAVRRDPGLLEQVDYKTFELRVFPIAAGAEQRISLTYYQQLNFDHNQASYVYPLATNVKGELDAKTRGKFAFTIDVKSEIPITALSSPSHENEFVVTNPSENYARASLEVTEGDLNRDVVIQYDIARAKTGIDLVTSKQGDEPGYFMLSMTAGKELEEIASGMDYLFVVDISGSMANDGKLSLSRNAVTSFIDALGVEDRFDVMTFNTSPNLQFSQLRKADEESLKLSSEFLLQQQARGGTELRPAVLAAYKFKDNDRPLNVVILSDGMTEATEQAELLAAIKQAPSGTRVFCIGIGNDINRPLLKQVAEGAGGLAAFISHQDDFGRQAQAFRRKLLRPVATNVKIRIDDVEAHDLANDVLPDLYYGAPMWIIGRYDRPGEGKVTITADVMGKPIEQSLRFNFPAADDTNPEIDRLWATTRVNKLMDEMRSQGKSTSKIDEIVRLCEGYSIVSEYASFIVLENDAEYERWAIARRNATRIQRDRAAQKQLRTELSLLRDRALTQIGPTTEKLVSSDNSNLDRDESTKDQATRTKPPVPGSANSVPSNPGDLNFDRSPNQTPANTSFSNSDSNDGGGGAIDPITGLLVAGSAAASALAARRQRKRKSQE